MDNSAHKEKWAKMSYIWGLVQRPGRPSQGDLKNYRDLVLSSDEFKNVLILGSTPEIRDMFIEMNKEGYEIKVTCVDMVKDMYHAMENLMKNSPNAEEFVEGNWLELSSSLKENQFDIVIGDWVSVNVGKERSKFYSEIKRILKPSGSFIERSGLIAPETPKIEKNVDSVMSVVKEQAEKVRLGEITKDQAWNYFISKLMMSAYYLNDQNRIDWGDSYINEIREVEKIVLANADPVEKYIFEKFNEVYGPTSGKYWTIYSKEETEKVYGEHFDIKDIRVSEDYDYVKTHESPIYLLGNK
jgi:ubiquinone/menaquinone biosynthesis C-methylase UbiE